MAAVPYQDSGLCVMWWRIEGGVEGGKSWKNGKNAQNFIGKVAKMGKFCLEKRRNVLMGINNQMVVFA